jgi:hypothetical protein
MSFRQASSRSRRGSQRLGSGASRRLELPDLPVDRAARGAQAFGLLAAIALGEDAVAARSVTDGCYGLFRRYRSTTCVQCAIGTGGLEEERIVEGS